MYGNVRHIEFQATTSQDIKDKATESAMTYWILVILNESQDQYNQITVHKTDQSLLKFIQITIVINTFNMQKPHCKDRAPRISRSQTGVAASISWCQMQRCMLVGRPWVAREHVAVIFSLWSIRRQVSIEAWKCDESDESLIRINEHSIMSSKRL